jgi:hypothetical protein
MLAPSAVSRTAKKIWGGANHGFVLQGQVEDGIAQKETAYLESTPSGNIVTGFDNYLKGNTGAAAQRRKTGTMDQNRVFSRSSISYRPNNGVSSRRTESKPRTRARARDRDCNSAHLLSKISPQILID